MKQTIQDAVHVCRTLGIQYLWVDALCIIQDDLDEKDWYEQSRNMRQIYSNCHLTIAADDSPGCTDGFWKIREGEWRKVIPSHMLYSRRSPSWIRVKESDKDTLSVINILSTRGWALQENILPNRILHFTTRGMKWECNHCCRDEHGEAEFNLLMLTFRILRVIKLSMLTQRPLLCFPEQLGGSYIEEDEVHTTHITDSLTKYTRTTVYFAWNSIMEQYSGKVFTKQADRLSAISGIARLIVEYLGLQSSAYLAGLWLEDLASGLLWYVKGPRTPRRAQLYIAPTWSWASIDGCIEYFKERYQFHFESLISVSKAKCISSSLDPTGRVTAGHIILTGNMVPVALNVLFPEEYKSEYKADLDVPHVHT
jgi:Heterokaryon incompatibility protein (HET)